MMTNPFYITGNIPDPYFCDREKETAKIISLLKNGENVLLTAFRRMGKTQLIRHVYAQEEIASQYYTLYTDIYSATSLREMTFLLSKEVFRTIVPQGKKALRFFLQTIRSLAAKVSLDPVSGIPELDLHIGDIAAPELTLKEIFSWLENAQKPCIFAIDEFQQIAKFPEKNVEALLRTQVQKMNRCHFIFSGSDRHILEQMFASYARPFYNSAQPVFLDRIDPDKYVAFAVGHFVAAGRTLTEETARFCYDMLDGYTYYVHKVFHNLFASGVQEVNMSAVMLALGDILEENTHMYTEIMAGLSTSQKQVLAAVAKEKLAMRPTSGAFVRKYALPSPSSVQKALLKLLDTGLVTFYLSGEEKCYAVADKFFELWLRETY